jgi:hypothetical protein
LCAVGIAQHQFVSTRSEILVKVADGYRLAVLQAKDKIVAGLLEG